MADPARKQEMAVALTVDELRELMRAAVREALVTQEADQDEVMTREEAAGLLKVHPDVLIRYVRQFALPGHKVGSEWRFRRSELLNWLAQRGTGPGESPRHWGDKLRQAKERT
jgi:excisionase family DNA binding protein